MLNKHKPSQTKWNFGLSDRIRMALKSGPKGVDELSILLNVSRESLYISIAYLCSKAGGIAATGKHGERVYALYSSRRTAAQGEGGNVTPAPYRRGYRWVS